jgi:hypothetical protein
MPEEMPKKFYIFCNLLNLQTAHNLRYTGGFASAGAGYAGVSKAVLDGKFEQAYLDGTAEYLPYSMNRSDSLSKVLSPFLLNVTNEYRVEFDAETYRIAHTPLLPSRLSAIYAFGDWDSCKRVSEAYGWNLDTVSLFALEPGPYNRIVKVNMEVVTLARNVYPFTTFMTANIESIWGHYWRGDANLTLEVPSLTGRKIEKSGIIWEYLIEGRVNRVDGEKGSTY